jgi:hypothetical protein
MLAVACDPFAIQKCHDQMTSSQEVMLKIDTNELEQVDRALVAVDETLTACKKAALAEEISKVQEARRQLSAQAEGLRARANRKKRPQLSNAEMEALKKEGDPSCPQGQQYEHAQNQALIRCTGPQLIEMNWAQTLEYFERRGFTSRPEGSVLSMELGVEAYDFHFAEAESNKGPDCVEIVAKPGVPWQEIVTRASSVHPRKLKLGSPVPTKRGAMDLLVEGDSSQYTVKLGKCAATPGQKPLQAQE